MQREWIRNELHGEECTHCETAIPKASRAFGVRQRTTKPLGLELLNKAAKHLLKTEQAVFGYQHSYLLLATGTSTGQLLMQDEQRSYSGFLGVLDYSRVL